MSLQNLFSQFASAGNQSTGDNPQGANPLSSFASAIPGGLAGGAAAGGIAALLMSSKSARKMAGGAAKIGGAAVLGGLAFKALSNWKQNSAAAQQEAMVSAAPDANPSSPTIAEELSSNLNLTLIKAMISAAKSDGVLDSDEQKNIFDSIEKMQLNPEEKAAMFDAISRDIPVHELAAEVSQDDEKAQVYLYAYLAIEVDNQQERQYLDSLATALSLPEGFPAYLEQQANNGIQ